MKNFSMNMNADTAAMTAGSKEKSRREVITEHIVAILASAVVIGLLIFHQDRISIVHMMLMSVAFKGIFDHNVPEIKKAAVPAGIVTAIAAAVIIAVKGIWILNICYMSTLPFFFAAAASAVLLVKVLKNK